jgi:ABC-type long-subunit fatty acid transport system fused permease/ATPase subunit
MVTYHYVKFYVSIIIYLEVININLLLLLLFFLSVDHELVHGTSQELQDKISWNLVEL